MPLRPMNLLSFVRFGYRTAACRAYCVVTLFIVFLFSASIFDQGGTSLSRLRCPVCARLARLRLPGPRALSREQDDSFVFFDNKQVYEEYNKEYSQYCLVALHKHVRGGTIVWVGALDAYTRSKMMRIAFGKICVNKI